jgi:hypothetical protein
MNEPAEEKSATESGELKDGALQKRTAEFGAAIVSEARKRDDESQREAFLAGVERLIAARRESLLKERHYADAAAWYGRKLAAMESGAFKLDEIALAFNFDDADLNRANY